MGLHESQSRLFENMVGRSREFLAYLYPTIRNLFVQFRDVMFEDFYRAFNAVKPGMIRVEADEVTYNLHIMLRFEIERALLSGDLQTADLPAAWNEKMQQYLGLTPENDREGVLQDVHWSLGLIGYFPSYMSGTLAATPNLPSGRSDTRSSQRNRGRQSPPPHHLASGEYVSRGLSLRISGDDSVIDGRRVEQPVLAGAHHEEIQRDLSARVKMGGDVRLRAADSLAAFFYLKCYNNPI
jgi:hypothetical protein